MYVAPSVKLEQCRGRGARLGLIDDFLIVSFFFFIFLETWENWKDNQNKFYFIFSLVLLFVWFYLIVSFIRPSVYSQNCYSFDNYYDYSCLIEGFEGRRTWWSLRKTCENVKIVREGEGEGRGSNFCTVEIILYGRWRIIWHKVRDVFLGELLVGLSWIWITFRMDGSGNGNTRELDGSGNARLGKGKLFHGKIISSRGFPKQFFD